MFGALRLIVGAFGVFVGVLGALSAKVCRYGGELHTGVPCLQLPEEHRVLPLRQAIRRRPTIAQKGRRLLWAAAVCARLRSERRASSATRGQPDSPPQGTKQDKKAPAVTFEADQGLPEEALQGPVPTQDQARMALNDDLAFHKAILASCKGHTGEAAIKARSLAETDIKRCMHAITDHKPLKQQLQTLLALVDRKTEEVTTAKTQSEEAQATFTRVTKELVEATAKQTTF